MAIVVRLDLMLAKTKTRSKDLAAQIGITEANLSLLKSGKVRGIRLDTLNNICRALGCQPGDLLEYVTDDSAQLDIDTPSSQGSRTPVES